MTEVIVEGSKKKYSDDTSFLTLAKEFQSKFPCDILLVIANGKLQELHKKIKPGMEITFVTSQEETGIKTYSRSVVFLMLKAFYEVVGEKQIKKVTVDFSLGNGLFVVPQGDFLLTQELLNQVKEKMHQYVNEEIPILKRSIPIDDAIELFRKHQMFEKEELFHYRRVSNVNIYSLDGFEDYFYGYMVPNTSYLRYFDLVSYQHGFLLMVPTKENPKEVPPIPQREKLFETLKEAGVWGEQLNVSNVASLNHKIVQGKFNELVLIQEALQEKKIGDIADLIASQENKKIVMIAGPSSSGKTTFSHRLSIQLRAKGLTPHPIAVDNYFVNRVDSPKDEFGNYDYESIKCMDTKQFNEDMSRLLAGERVELPYYNFLKGEREYRGESLKLEKNDILVIEGIHCLNEDFTYQLPNSCKFKIYISALVQLNVDEHNRITTTDGRLLRRMVRDARTRGASASDTINRWYSVRQGEERNIFPYQECADVMFNSSLVYELAIMKQYAEPLLFGIPRNCPEYVEAKRLLKFLDYFIGISSENIPNNSILREFIGGSCFHT